MRLFQKVTPITLALLGLVAIAAPARAQDDSDDDDDHDWMQECRRSDFGRHRSHRYRHCEVRETGISHPQGKLTVDPGRNGGVAVRAWDKDSIAIVAKVQTQSGSAEDAERMAEEIRIVTSGGTIRAEGRSCRSRSTRRATWTSTSIPTTARSRCAA
jgi:hypothetical protein